MAPDILSDHACGTFADGSFTIMEQNTALFIFLVCFKILSLVTIHKDFCAGNPYPGLSLA